MLRLNSGTRGQNLIIHLLWATAGLLFTCIQPYHPLPLDEFSFEEMRTWSQCKISSSCLCVWYNSRELIYRGSPRFPTPMVKSSSKDLLPPIKSYWVESQPAFMDSCLSQAFGLSTQQISTSQQTFVLMKTSFFFVVRRHLEDVLIKTNIFILLIRLQDFLIKTNIFVLVIRLQDVFKTSSRRLAKTSSRHLEDVFKTFSFSFSF